MCDFLLLFFKQSDHFQKMTSLIIVIVLLITSVSACIDPCLTCQGGDTYCLTCIDANRSSDQAGQCLCNSGYVEILNTCEQCLSPCLTCQGSDQFCLTCIDANRSANLSGQCLCNSGYVEILNTCQQCLSPCKKCLVLTTTCTNCVDQNMNLINNQCICKSGYLNQDNQCLRCVSTCSECSGNQFYCTTCSNSHLTPQNGICFCQSYLDMNDLSLCWCYSLSTYYRIINNLCQPTCIDNCSVCSGQLKCTNCISGYYLNDINCDQCVQSCQECNNSLTCTQCLDYYYINNQQTCSNCCQNCINCTSQNCNDCTKCSDNYYLKDGSCFQCSLPCKTCTSDTVCLTCVQAYQVQIAGQCQCIYYSIDINGTCTSCEDPCWTCQGSVNYCITCISNNMVLSNGICTCPLNTHVLSQNYYCDYCSSSCKYCLNSVSYCTQCWDIALLQADNTCKCPDGYTFSSSLKKCQLCQIPCENCIVYTYNCTSCIDKVSMYLSSNSCYCIDGYVMLLNICQPCISPCKKCSANQNFCTLCVDLNMTLNASTGKCTCNSNYLNLSNICYECSLPCTTCQSQITNCQSCVDPNMMLNNGTCTCKPYYYESNYICNNCVSPCVLCTSQTNCSSCIQGYAMVQTQCLPCTSPCVNCSIDQNYCTSCVDINMNIQQGLCVCKQTYAQISNICYPCIAPCVNCLQSQNYCTSCIDSQMISIQGLCQCNSEYYLKTSILCEVCKYPCSACTNDTDCTSCLPGLNRSLVGNKCNCDFEYYDDGVCKQCPFPCLDCNSQYDCTICRLNHMTPVLGVCECNKGYVLIGQQCVQCADQCSTCQNTIEDCVDCIDVNMDILSQPKCQCKVGYYQSSPQQCTQCIEPCQTCTGVGTFCLSCSRQNQFLKDNKCECLDGYAEVDSQCQLCKLPCSKCAGPLTLCTSCIDPIQQLTNRKCECPSNHFFDISFMCQICQLPCLTCQDSSTFCLKCNDEKMELNNQNQCSCQSGYYETDYRCEQCIEGCQYCNDGDACILCYQSYMLDQQNNCLPCLEPCQTCEIQTNMCTSCLNNKLKVIENTCQCAKQEYFFEENCYPCSNYCFSCSSSSTCDKCLDINNLVLIDGYCQCPVGYIDNGTDCQICNSFCEECQNDVNNCTKCFLTQNRELKQNNKCECFQGYYDDGSLDCKKCTNIDGIDKRECNYENCDDGIFTWGEKCDDGNNRPHDGCTNCRIDQGYQCSNIILQPSICQTCSLNCANCDQDLFCLNCDDGYYLQDQRCLVCNNVCQTCDTYKDCIICKYIKLNGKCSTCDQKTGYVLDKENEKCISTCGDGIISDIEQCDDGNQLNGDGCNSNCKLEKGYLKVGGILIYVKPLKPKIQELQTFNSVYNSSRTFILNYNYLLQHNAMDYLQYINISITNKNLLIDYTMHIEDCSVIENNTINFTIRVDLELKSTTVNEQLKVLFITPSKFVAQNKIQQTIKEIQIKITKFQFIDPSAKNNQQKVMQLNQYILYIMGALALIGLLTGGLEIFYSILDLIQLISYLRYINVEFPYNLEEFLNLFKFGQISNLNQQFLSINVNDYLDQYIDKSQIVDPAEKIAIDGFSTNILFNLQPFIQTWTLFLVFYLLANLLFTLVSRIQVSSVLQTTYFKVKTSNLKYFLKYQATVISWNFKNNFFWSIQLRTFYSTAYDLSFIIVLNLSYYQKQPSYYLNQIGQLVSLILLLIYFITIFKQLGIFNKKKFISKQLINQYGAIQEGLKLNRFSIYFNIFNQLKKLLMMMALVCLTDIPLLQSISILILNKLTVLYLILFRPLKDRKEFLKQSSSEIQITILQLLITFFVIEQQIQILNYDQKSYLGWAAILLILLMILTQIGLAFSQQMKIYTRFFKIIQKYLDKLTKKKANHHKRPILDNIRPTLQKMRPPLDVMTKI